MDSLSRKSLLIFWYEKSDGRLKRGPVHEVMLDRFGFSFKTFPIVKYTEFLPNPLFGNFLVSKAPEIEFDNATLNHYRTVSINSKVIFIISFWRK